MLDSECAPSNGMKIAMAYHQFLPNYGGIENHLYYLSRALINRKHNLTILTTNLVKMRPRSLISNETIDGIHVIRLPAFAVKNIIPICPAAFVKKIPMYDILHLHSLNPNLFMTALQIRAKVNNSPVIITPHLHPERLSYYSQLSQQYFALALSTFLRKATIVIALTPTEKKFYEEQYGVTRVLEIPNGVDLTLHKTDQNTLFLFQQSHDPGKRKILFVGRITKEKGIEIIIRSLPAILKVLPEAIFYVVGAYTEHVEYLQALTKTLGCEKHVRFFFNPPNTEMPYFYEIADIVVMPSLQIEGQPIVALESWAHRKPIIATNRGGIRDLLSQGGGKPMESFNPKIWGENILDLLNSDKKIRILGQEGRKLIEDKYTWKRVAKLVEKCYRSTL